MVWPVDTPDQRPHVRRGARAGDKYQVAAEPFSAETSRIEQVSRPRDDPIRGKQQNVERHQQTGRSHQFGTERYAHRSAAGNPSKRSGDPGIRRRELFIRGLDECVWQALKRGDQTWINKLWRGDDHPVRPPSDSLHRLTHRAGLPATALNNRRCFPRVGFKNVSEIRHDLVPSGFSLGGVAMSTAMEVLLRAIYR